MKSKDFQRYCHSLPAPIALSLNKAAQNIEEAGRMHDLCSALERFTRYLVAIAQAEYCAYGKDQKVNSTIIVTEQPIANGNALRRSGAIFQFLRKQKKAFTSEIIDWYFDRKGKETEAIRLLNSLIERRNKFIHKEISLADMRAFPEELLHFFDMTPWLERYDLFMVLTQQPSEPVGTEGTLRWLMGLESPSDIKESHWTNVRLYNQEIYLLHPQQEGFLRLYPFLAWREDEMKNGKTLFLWTKIGRKKIEYQSMYSRAETREHIQYQKDELAWADFVQQYPVQTVLWLDDFEHFELEAESEEPEAADQLVPEYNSAEEESAVIEPAYFSIRKSLFLLFGLVILVFWAQDFFSEEAQPSPPVKTKQEVTIRFEPAPPEGAVFFVDQKPIQLTDALLLIELDKGEYPLGMEVDGRACTTMVEELAVTGDLAIQVGWNCLGRVGYEMKRVKGGTFTIGAPPEMREQDPDEKQIQVTLNYNYAIGVTEVTQGLWKQLTDKNPSHFGNCPSCPVESISWFDAVSFANMMSAREFLEPCYQINGEEIYFYGVTCEGYRLPTEVEWEIAARGGRSFVYSGSQSPVLVAVFQFNSEEKTAPVASLKPNGLGLYDMSGNVYEWCQDFYGSYAELNVDTFLNEKRSKYRVGRGGSYRSRAKDLRVMNRSSALPSSKQAFIGLRLARTLKKGKDKVYPER